MGEKIKLRQHIRTQKDWRKEEGYQNQIELINLFCFLDQQGNTKDSGADCDR